MTRNPCKTCGTTDVDKFPSETEAWCYGCLLANCANCGHIAGLHRDHVAPCWNNCRCSGFVARQYPPTVTLSGLDYKALIQKQDDLKKELENLKKKLEDETNFLEQLRGELRKQDRALDKLDLAMASPERIAADTAAVGGFVSSLNLTETQVEVIERATKLIQDLKTKLEAANPTEEYTLIATSVNGPPGPAKDAMMEEMDRQAHAHLAALWASTGPGKPSVPAGQELNDFVEKLVNCKNCLDLFLPKPGEETCPLCQAGLVSR